MMRMPMDEADAMELAERLVREVAKRGQGRLRVAADIVLRTMEAQRRQIVGFERAVMTGDLSGIEQPSHDRAAQVAPTVDNHTGAACHECFGGAGGLQRCDRCGVDVCGHCRVLGEQFAPEGLGKHYCGECADRLVSLRAAGQAASLCSRDGQCVRPNRHDGKCRRDPVNQAVRQ